ncbi:MAG: serine--tRNA ligase, partial [Oligoflexia bacterium]|nr:serine--tRNA ligase [Oligoflexia bacterium]
MLDLKFIRENPGTIREVMRVKNIQFNLERLLEVDLEVQSKKQRLQDLQTDRNANAKKIPKASAEERPGLIEQGKAIGNEIEAIKPALSKLEEELQELLWLVPNIPATDAPIGKDENDNVERERWGEIPSFDFTP